MLCYVMLCYVMLCYVMLCYVMLCYVMLCYVMLCICKYIYMYINMYSPHWALGSFKGQAEQSMHKHGGYRQTSVVNKHGQATRERNHLLPRSALYTGEHDYPCNAQT